MAQLFSGVSKPEELLLESDREEHRPLIRNLAAAASAHPVPPRKPETDDPLPGCNLLTRRKDREGNQKPESPSGLEVLLVSPLMWLLQRYGMEPREWVADTLDVMTRGTLAHSVFESLFAPGRPLPEKSDIPKLVTTALAAAIKETFPLLECDEWRVEFRHLNRDIEKAALAWVKMLEELSAKVIAVEATLVGKLDALPLSGKADLLLLLPDDRMLVVDYKKSGSKGRIERMKKGFDMQTSLYRIMLETGGVANDEALAGSLKNVGEIGAMYYLLNDQTAVSDSSGWTAGNIAGFLEMGDGISENALMMIRERIGQLEAGRIALNSTADEEWFEKNAGIKPYAFDNSPLVRLFMKQDEITPGELE
jgi:RecB family exonuclease